MRFHEFCDYLINDEDLVPLERVEYLHAFFAGAVNGNSVPATPSPSSRSSADAAIFGSAILARVFFAGFNCLRWILRWLRRLNGDSRVRANMYRSVQTFTCL